jgi:hypothetical protein
MMRASARSTGGANETYSVSGAVPRPQVHHDQFPSVQAFQPLTAQAQSVHLARKAGLEVGLAWDGAASWRGSSGRFGLRR